MGPHRGRGLRATNFRKKFFSRYSKLKLIILFPCPKGSQKYITSWGFDEKPRRSSHGQTYTQTHFALLVYRSNANVYEEPNKQFLFCNSSASFAIGQKATKVRPTYFVTALNQAEDAEDNCFFCLLASCGVANG